MAQDFMDFSFFVLAGLRAGVCPDGDPEQTTEE
jgi:hypothetical protein